MKGSLSSTGLQRQSVTRLTSEAIKWNRDQASMRKTLFLWKESKSHNDLIAVGRDANAGPSNATPKAINFTSTGD